jgi:hypothetical protein
LKRLLAAAALLALAGAARADDPPAGWWIVEHVTVRDDVASPGTALRFSGAEVAIARNGKLVDRRKVKYEASGEGAWKGTGGMVLELARAKDKLLMKTRRPTTEWRLREAREGEAKPLDGIVAAERDIDATCSRAERCCVEAMKLLKQKCDANDELGARDSWLRCQAVSSGMRMVLVAAQKKAPAACE